MAILGIIWSRGSRKNGRTTNCQVWAEMEGSGGLKDCEEQVSSSTSLGRCMVQAVHFAYDCSFVESMDQFLGKQEYDRWDGKGGEYAGSISGQAVSCGLITGAGQNDGGVSRMSLERQSVREIPDNILLYCDLASLAKSK